MTIACDLVLFNCTAFVPEPLPEAYIGIRNGTIAYVGTQKPDGTAETAFIDMQRRFVLPGLIDSHVHFRTPGLDHKEDYRHGSMAALAGGVTTVLDMPNTKPEISTRAALQEKEQTVQKLSYVHYGHHFLLTRRNLEEIKCLQAGDVASVKVFMAGHETAEHTVYDYNYLLEAAGILAAKGMLMTVHAEYEPLLKRTASMAPSGYEEDRRRDAAIRAVEMMIGISRQTGCQIHIVHTSTEEEASLIIAAKSKGIPVTCEVIPPHLVFTNEDLLRKGWDFKLSPPLRTRRDAACLWEHLITGYIDTIGSDHAPHTRTEKNSSSPPAGMPGVQEMVSVIFSGFIDRGLNPEQAAALIAKYLSQRPAELFHIPGKGRLAQGFDADLTVLEPFATFVMTDEKAFSKCKWSIYTGQSLRGEVQMVFLNGTVVYANNVIQTEQPTGRKITLESRRCTV
ncbi:MAG: dihydroorotase family protein [Paenibacillus macerans]|uniref:Dihydroorotase n=1 Tax=Paenibacillus macerans TaxID=44252 RepID=A0A090Y5M9_PAEMA|nr:dihydroorotase family protein [Paenibacillus macerans]KFM93501.1 dihydroorotase [Paenibacillus macerans]MCY7562607.1 dihydroorotase family protein [Paenibacillus macerans]MDU7477338.1 dihydroorotase family protein [Paenibacillus macerans]MEC0154147.1 dihydroorotase family protein [Paenibacillus macerans]SUA86367.1 allantoinase [Paenibacillus macerans]